MPSAVEGPIIRIFLKLVARSFTDKVQRDFAAMRRDAVFPQINALPRSEREMSIPQRHAQIDSGQRGANVGRHVVIAFRGVNEQSVAIGNEAFEKILQV